MVNIPSNQLLNSPVFKKIKQNTLKIIKCGEAAIKMSNLNSETCEMMLEKSLQIINAIKPFCLLPSIPETGTEVIEKGLKLIKKNHKMIKKYDQDLQNVKLIIESDGVKN